MSSCTSDCGAWFSDCSQLGTAHVRKKIDILEGINCKENEIVHCYAPPNDHDVHSV